MLREGIAICVYYHTVLVNHDKLINNANTYDK